MERFNDIFGPSEDYKINGCGYCDNTTTYEIPYGNDMRTDICRECFNKAFPNSVKILEKMLNDYQEKGA